MHCMFNSSLFGVFMLPYLNGWELKRALSDGTVILSEHLCLTKCHMVVNRITDIIQGLYFLKCCSLVITNIFIRGMYSMTK
jgi:hypothetical protein